MTQSFEPEHEHLSAQQLLEELHFKHDSILDGFRKVLAEHGMEGIDISKFGLRLKSGAPPCPSGRPATFKCVLNATGEYECKWVCE